MKALECFEITDLFYVGHLMEPLTLQLIDSSDDLIHHISKCLSLETNYSTSFSHLSNELNLKPERLLNSIYILELRSYVNIENIGQNRLVLTQTIEGEQRVKLLPNQYGGPVT